MTERDCNDIKTLKKTKKLLSEWEEITRIFQRALKRTNLAKKEVDEITENIIKDVRDSRWNIKNQK